MPNLQKLILDERKTYELNIHYKIFTMDCVANGDIDHSKNEVYLTYKGVLKVLFCSRSGNAESFLFSLYEPSE